MSKLDIRQKIQDILEKHFVKNKENEWVSVDKVNINRIDVDVVTSIDEKTDESSNFIKNNINSFNETLSKAEKIYLGFCNIYSLEEADFLGIEKPYKKSKVTASFGDIIDNNENSVKNDKRLEATRVISFYSYKGGVGRTVALVQTANLLSAKGKKVALIDMDIEAPSFNDIFSDDIQTENGLVNYLYNKLYNLEKIEVSSIVSKLSLNTKGDVYIVPAGNINKKYVKMLESLKERRISENQYIKNLINELQDKYGIEYALIDSRTGINNWGALSIGEIADEIILFAYPNKENVNGINLILDIIEDRKKCTVVFSRIDVTDEGKRKARQFFDEINIEQEFIGIEYDSAVAVATKYPLEDRLNKFKCISELILEDEVNKFNANWIRINKEKSDKILDDLEQGKYFSKILTNDESKFNNKSNYIIVKNNKIKLKDIVNEGGYKENLFEFKVYDFELMMLSNSNKPLITAITNILAIAAVNCNNYIEPQKEHNIEMDFENYFQRLDVGVKNEKDYLKSIVTNFRSILDSIEEKSNVKRIYLNININDILKYRFSKVADNIKIELVLIIIEILNLNDKFQFKLVFNEEEYEKYKDDLKSVKANMLNLSWRYLNQDVLIDNIRQIFQQISKYANGIYSNDEIVKNVIEKEKLSIYDASSKILVGSNLIYCKRIDSTKYSKEFIIWLSDKIQEKKLVSKKDVLDIIRESARIEKLNPKEGKNSIITFESFNKAIQKLTNEIKTTTVYKEF
ncbi:MULTISPECIES: AAA family ATPase [Clostridium]|uniref:Cell division inhibitor MinD n=1 Tax=Clostridium ragsdalei P11 TaxID=1353534 RepID=A0A1A6B4D4_9CLOT|nr:MULTISPECIES: AAA family ATPase [Clostridium]OBR97162.1 cell division inhibitor MinD [Clostridium ragsdalei P11]QXE20883.1 hypothetical protein B5S50_19620 [Clostridium sp. 001]